MTDRDRLIELLLKCNKDNDVLSCFNERPRKKQSAEIIADYLIANGVIVPQCKVGDLVYVIRRKEKRNKGGYWNAICFTKKVMQTAIKDGTAYIDCKRATKTDFSLIGKTVFLTREDAKKALERSQT